MQTELYTAHAPSEELRPFVRRFLHIDAVSDARVRTAATGYVHLGVFFRAAPCRRSPQRQRHSPGAGWYVFGSSRDRRAHVRACGTVGHLLAEFTPTGFYRLTNIAAERVTHVAVNVGTLAPSLAAGLASVGLGDACAQERVHRTDQQLCALIAGARAEDATIARAAQMLEATHGCLRIDAMCDALGVSERQLSRRFRRIVGVTPKYFAQARQVHHAVEHLLKDSRAGLTALALAAGFYDQSHFVKAMHGFFGEAPTRFLRLREQALA